MNNQEVSWFLLNYIAPTAPRCNSAEFAIDKFNAATASQLDVFAPTFIEVVKCHRADEEKEQAKNT